MTAFLARLFGSPRLHIDIDLWLVRFYLRLGAENVYVLEFVWIYLRLGTGRTPLFGLAVTRQATDFEGYPRIGWPNYCAVRLPGWHREWRRP